MIEVIFVSQVQIALHQMELTGTLMRTVLSYQIQQSVIQTYHALVHVPLVTIALIEGRFSHFHAR